MIVWRDGRDRLLPRPTRGRFLTALISILLLLVACSDGDEAPDASSEDTAPKAGPATDPERVERVADLVSLVTGPDAEEISGQPYEIEAWVSPPARTSGLPSIPPEGCPIVPEKQDWISDQLITTQLEVAGATIPNANATRDVPALRLVIPYQLGFVEVPAHGRFRGYLLDEEHRDCPSAETFFVLEEVVEEFPPDEAQPDDDVAGEWEEWSHADSGLRLEYPAGWEIEERDTGVSVRVRFVGPERFRSVRVGIQPGETYWHPNANEGAAQPEILLGERQIPATAGPARARLVDDRRRTGESERELRLVFNHRENTISMEMLLRDGAELETESLQVFNEMARRIRLEGDIAMSDPMDPVLAASEELGEGPFLSEADARYVALQAAGMTEAESLTAELVSERAAREATDSACRDFGGNPDGVWLVTVDGVLPNGQQSARLVYLDAETGDRLCQAEAPGVS